MSAPKGARWRRRPWPALPTKTLKLRHDSDLSVDATVSVASGRPVVAMSSARGQRGGYGIEDFVLTPDEAERLARALTAAAACCRAKAEVAGG